MPGTTLTTRRRWIVFFSAFLLSASAGAQFRQIDPAKLPQDQRVRAAYSGVQAVESMAHRWSPKWTYNTPKDQVVAQLTSGLNDLRSAETAAPGNEELLLLTGLVAHLAYNLDVEETWDVAVQS